MASFPFHRNYPGPALIDQVKIVTPCQTKSKYFISQHLSKSEKEQAPFSLNAWLLHDLKDE